MSKISESVVKILLKKGAWFYYMNLGENVDSQRYKVN